MTVYFQGSELDALQPFAGAGSYTEEDGIRTNYARRYTTVRGATSGYISADAGVGLQKMWIKLDGIPGVLGLNRLVFTVHSSSEVQVARVIGTETGWEAQFQVWSGSSWLDVGPPFNMAGGARYNIRLEKAANPGDDDIAELYRNEMLACRSKLPGLLSAVTDFRSFRIHVQHNVYATTFGEVVLADESTLDWAVQTIVPNSNGADQDGTGLVTDINETPLNNGTFVGFNAPGQRRSFKAAARTIISEVKGFTVTGRMRKSDESSLDTVKPYVVPGGQSTRFYGPEFTLDLGYLNYQHTWNVNPVTEIPWTAGEVNDPNLEWGWEVV